MTEQTSNSSERASKPASQPPAVPAKPVFSHSIHSFIPRLLKIEPTPVKTSALCVSLLLLLLRAVMNGSFSPIEPFPLHPAHLSNTRALRNRLLLLLIHARRLFQFDLSTGLWASITWLALCKNQLTHFIGKTALSISTDNKKFKLLLLLLFINEVYSKEEHTVEISTVSYRFENWNKREG